MRDAIEALLPLAVTKLREFLESKDPENIKWAAGKVLDFSLPRPKPLESSDEVDKLKTFARLMMAGD